MESMIKVSLTKIIWKLLFVMLAGLPAVACTAMQNSFSSQSTTTELTPLRLCTSAISGTQIVAWYADEQGFFERYGLDVTLIPVTGGSTAAIALIAGEADMCQMAGNAVVNAAASGEDLVMISGLFNRHIHTLIAREGIRSSAELAGKSVGISSIGGSSDAAMRAAARHFDLDPDTDITILGLGSQSNRIAALETGEVAAVLLSEPMSSSAQQLGYSNLLELSELPEEYQHVGLVTTRTKIAEDPDAMRSAMKAISDAIFHMRRDAQGVKAVMASHLDLDPDEDRKTLDSAYKSLVLDHLSVTPYPTLAGLETIIIAAAAENPATATISATDIIDLSFIKELEESGFIRNLQE